MWRRRCTSGRWTVGCARRYIYWRLVLLARKFGLVFATLMFSGNATFAGCVGLVVVIVAYAVHVHCLPFLVPSARAAAAAAERGASSRALGAQRRQSVVLLMAAAAASEGRRNLMNLNLLEVRALRVPVFPFLCVCVLWAYRRGLCRARACALRWRCCSRASCFRYAAAAAGGACSCARDVARDARGRVRRAQSGQLWVGSPGCVRTRFVLLHRHAHATCRACRYLLLTALTVIVLVLSVGLFVWLVASETRKQCAGSSMKPAAAPVVDQLLREAGAWTSNPMAAKQAAARGALVLLAPLAAAGGGGVA